MTRRRRVSRPSANSSRARRRRAPSPDRADAATNTALVKSGPWLYRAAGAAVLLLLGLMAVFPIQSDDVFMYLAIGRRAARQGQWPTIDPFLFSISNYHWHILHEWGAHRLAYALYVLGGWTALIVGKAALLLAIAATPLLLARRLRTHSGIVPLVILLASSPERIG